MSLYPSLEDMKVDQMMKAQLKEPQYSYNGDDVHHPPHHDQPPPAYPTLMGAGSRPGTGGGVNEASAPPLMNAAPIYPSLANYMGLDISPKTIAMNMPEYSMALSVRPSVEHARPLVNNMVAPISGQSIGLKRAQVTNGIRELILCKDKDGKIGLRVAAVNSGIFVCLVARDSPAALGGVRFGDQILQINGTVVAGFTMDQVHKLFRKANVNGISVIIRDRPFERTVTLHKDSAGTVGFQFKRGEIVSLVKDSSATRNGLLTQHHLLEVDGQNVVGLKDKEILAIIDRALSPLTVTVIPTFVYEHIVSKMSCNLIKNLMSHNVPEI